MWNPFRKKEIDFLLDIEKNLIQQSESGQVGKEVTKDVLFDSFGHVQDVGGEISEVTTDESGTPQIQKARLVLLLDCGHTVYSREGVGGRCDYGHIVCVKERLYTCAWCRRKLCDRDATIWINGHVTCNNKKCQRKWKKELQKLEIWEEKNNKKGFEPDLFKY